MSIATTTAKWVATNSPVANSRTDDIWFFDADTGWLVNSNGQVSRTADGGNTWEQKFFLDPASTAFPYLRCLAWGSDLIGWFGAVTGFTGGTKDYLKILLHKTTDGGDTWAALSNLPEDSPAGVCGLYAVNEQVVYGSGTNDPNLPGPGIVKTVDGGANWQFIDMAAHADNLIDIYFFDATTGWVVGGKKDPTCPTIRPGYETHPQYAQLKPVVLKTTDGGATWQNMAADVAGFDCGEWGWKIQFLSDRVGFVALENFTSAAILKTLDGGESWTRLPIVDGNGSVINRDLEGIGFVSPSEGWVGGWGNAFEGLMNSFSEDGGESWVPENHVPADPNSDPRLRINRYRFLGKPISAGYCSGQRVYKLVEQSQVAAALAAVERVGPPSGSALSHVSSPTARSVSISYTLTADARKVFVGLWNQFAFHVRTLVDGESQPAGRHTVTWDGTDDTGKPLGGGAYICRMSIDGRYGESQTILLPDLP